MERWEIYKNHRISALLSLWFVSCQTQPTSTNTNLPSNSQDHQTKSCWQYLCQAWPWFKLIKLIGSNPRMAIYLLHQHTHLHWKKVISFKNCPSNDFQPSFASISCVLALHLGNPDSWSEAPANVKKGNSTWEAVTAAYNTSQVHRDCLHKLCSRAFCQKKPRTPNIQFEFVVCEQHILVGGFNPSEKY